MSTHDALGYYRRFLQQVWRGFIGWPRDNVLVAGFAAIAPPVVLYLRDPAKVPDLALLKMTGWVYLAILGLHTVIQIFRTPWKLDEDRASTIADLTQVRDELLAKWKIFEETRPRIVLRDPGAKHIEIIQLANRGLVVATGQFVKVRFINNPRSNSANAIAHGVRAFLKFFGEDGDLLLEMDGRWDDSKQPGEEVVSETLSNLLPIDFGIEEARNLDIGFFDRHIGSFVAWNNDNYRYQTFVKPEHVLKGKRFKVSIRLVGVGVDESFSIQFAITSDAKVTIIDPEER